MKKITLAVIATLTALAFAGTKMKIFYADGTTQLTPVSSIDSIAFITTESPGGGSVLLDNFEPHDGASSLHLQNALGAKVAKLYTSDAPWDGGGIWTAFASDNGATVSTYDNSGGNVTIVDSLGVEIVETGIMKKSIHDNFMKVVFDCRGLEDAYWAGISVNLAGMFDRGAYDLEGDTLISTEYEQVVCWNLSNLESISIDGYIYGAVFFNITGVTKETKMGVVQKSITSNITSNGGAAGEVKPFDLVVPVTDFSPASWQGAEWENIKRLIYSISIDLNTEVTDYAELWINSIVLNFKDEQSALEAFPFLK